ncbi:hypothetical protein ACVXAM_003841 [Vibrio parahaemolyticus]
MSELDWIIKLGSVVGASFQFAPNFIQLKAEIESYQLEKRLKVLEDPISSIDQDVVELSKLFYSDMKKSNDHHLDFSEEYKSYERTINLLNGAGYIDKNSVIIEFKNPIYVLYMAGWSESDRVLSEIVGYIDGCESGVSISLKDMRTSFDVPDKLILALFELYENKGLGFYNICVGHESYTAK